LSPSRSARITRWRIDIHETAKYPTMKVNEATAPAVGVSQPPVLPMRMKALPASSARK
jgi:hypothetical protein